MENTGNLVKRYKLCGSFLEMDLTEMTKIREDSIAFYRLSRYNDLKTICLISLRYKNLKPDFVKITDRQKIRHPKEADISIRKNFLNCG